RAARRPPARTTAAPARSRPSCAPGAPSSWASPPRPRARTPPRSPKSSPTTSATSSTSSPRLCSSTTRRCSRASCPGSTPWRSRPGCGSARSGPPSTRWPPRWRTPRAPLSSCATYAPPTRPRRR
ncbi:MAG: hypothetical protein AVDCRST_MAG54-3987, partial [uncultured Actinomycetospora sp.]